MILSPSGFHIGTNIPLRSLILKNHLLINHVQDANLNRVVSGAGSVSLVIYSAALVVSPSTEICLSTTLKNGLGDFSMQHL